MSNTTPGISVVIPILNAPELPALIQALLSQKPCAPNEILLLNSGESPVSTGPPHPCVREIPVYSFSHGRARNLGVQQAAGEIIVFLVQDALPRDADWLRLLLAPLTQGTAAATFSRQLPRSDAPPAEQAFLAHRFPDGDQPTQRTLSIDNLSPGLEDVFFSNVAAAAHRSTLLAYPFDEDLTMSEDQQFSRDLLLAGHSIAYCPQSVVIHSHAYSPLQLLRRYFDSIRSLGDIFPEYQPLSTIRLGRRCMQAEFRFLCRSFPLALPGWCGRLSIRAVAAVCAHLAPWLPGGVTRALSMPQAPKRRKPRPEKQHRPRVLVVSPTPSHPPNAGNRIRVQAICSALRQNGCELHFLYDNFEAHSAHVAAKPDFSAMAQAWDRFFLPSGSPKETPGSVLKDRQWYQQKLAWRLAKLFWFLYDLPTLILGTGGRLLKKTAPPLYSALKPLFPDRLPARERWNRHHSKKRHQIKNETKAEKEPLSEIDRWYNPKLGPSAIRLHQQFHYQAVWVNYVFLSSLLTDLDESVLKIIDTHDVFCERRKKFARKGLNDTFFSASPEEESRGLNRAHHIIAIQNQEREILRKITVNPVSCIGHPVPLLPPDPNRRITGRLLFLGSANVANIHGIRWFIKHCLPLIRQRLPHVQLLVAGHVCRDLNAAPGIHLLGERRNLNSIYAMADIVINPVQAGTGLNIKSIEALGRSKPLIASPVGCEGLEHAKGMLPATRPADFADAADRLLSDPIFFHQTARDAYAFAQTWNRDITHKLQELLANLPSHKTSSS